MSSTRWDGTLAQEARTLSVRLRYGRGTYTNFGMRRFGVDSAVPTTAYIIEARSGHAGERPSLHQFVGT